MDYSAWAPRYEVIRTAFGFPFAREEAAARRLTELLPPPAREGGLERAARRLAGREAVVVGLGPGAGPPPMWRQPAGTRPWAVVAADGAARACLDAQIVPDVIVTDLDGPVASEVTANRRGSLVVVHAHGDNLPALERWVPEFPGELAGSWAGPPTPALLDVGGFTDGDRAAYLAVHVGARRVWLWGFDFSNVPAEDADRPRKLAKLRWAERLLSELAATTPTPLLIWHRDGSSSPYPAGNALASTR